jgi:CheY-like chemotaxis protein
MIIYQETTGNGLAKHIYRDLAPASATDRPALLHSPEMMTQAGETADDKGPGRVSPPRSKSGDGQSTGRQDPRITVLVVDDEQPVREALVELLSIHGYRAITAGSAENAEEAKQELDIEGIHLVIADIHLTPGSQVRAGYVLAQRWRAMHPGLPIILISGDPSNQDLPDVQAGAMQFLLKPFRMEVFLEVIREALGQ